MAGTSANKWARKRLAWLLVLFIAFAGLITTATLTKVSGATFIPQLALDLQGGTQVILKPTVSSGTTVSKEQLAQAVDIIRQRIDSTGVSEAQIVTQGEGKDAAIVVSIPGKPSESTLELIKASAKLEFRPVLVTGAGVSALVTPAATKENPKPTPTLPSSTPIATSTAAPTDNSDLNWVSAELQAQYEALDCSSQFRTPGQIDDPKKPLVTCATCSTDTPFFIKSSKRSEATSSPPDIAMHPLLAKSCANSGVKVFSKRILPHQEIVVCRRSSSAASAFNTLGGAASSTK